METGDLFQCGGEKLLHERQRGRLSRPLPDVCIIFDTNIWLECLDFISEVYRSETYLIYIPDIVAIELNNIKSKGSTDQLRKLARQAIDFQNRTLQMSARVIQQRRDEAVASYERYKCFNNDDCVIASCIQLRREGKIVHLCTNDKSMQNFAHANGIPLYSQTNKRTFS